MEETSVVNDWPRRWHQVVAEYNTSFERRQNEMRIQFEERFDQIRRDNDELLQVVRSSRDDCAQRVCDLIDEQAEVTDNISGYRKEVSRLLSDESDLDQLIHALEVQVSDLTGKVKSAEEGSHQSQSRVESQMLAVAQRKSELREEIRDLAGFLSMHMRVCQSGGEGATIMSTNRRKLRR